MSTPSAAIIKEQVESALYDTIGEQIVAMEAAALAGAEYNHDYRCCIEAWSGNYIYKDTKGCDFQTIIVGEIQGPDAGTIICAKGNHYPGAKKAHFHPVTDDSRVKDVLVLGLPTGATELLQVIMENQLMELNTILNTDDKAEEEAGKDRPSKEWVKNAEGSGDEPVGKDLIIVHMLPKYGKPTGVRSSGTAARHVAKHSLSTMESEEADIPPPPLSDDSMAIHEGAFYDPYLNKDYGGPYFHHICNKLVQLDVWDENNELVAPWKFPEALRPGTVVLLNCSLHCFIMKEKNSEKRIYQLNAHSVRILARSDIMVPEPVRPTIPNDDEDMSPAGGIVMGKDSAAMVATMAFNAFSTGGHGASSGASSVATTSIESAERKTKKPKKTVHAKPSSSMEVDG